MAWPIQTLGTLLCCLLVVTLAGQEVSQLSLAQPMIKAVCPTSEDMEMQHRGGGRPTGSNHVFSFDFKKQLLGPGTVA